MQNQNFWILAKIDFSARATNKIRLNSFLEKAGNIIGAGGKTGYMYNQMNEIIPIFS